LSTNPISKIEPTKEQTGWHNKLILGDCLEVLKQMPESFVDLIVTSPPYADSRKNTYGGIHPDNYVEWFLPTGAELRRVFTKRETCSIKRET
jgi:DNA modification methylase